MLWQSSKWISNIQNKRTMRFPSFRRSGAIPEKTIQNRAPLFRREFEVEFSVKSAMLYVSGLGYYEAWINHHRVGDHVLDPAQTDYEKRVFYVSYDVTDLIQTGKNCLGIMLGNGWYNQNRISRNAKFSYGPPCLICEIQITFGNGNVLVIPSDKSWSWSQGPIIDDNIYAGESYDARLERVGWDMPDFNATDWAPVIVVRGPGGHLEPQLIPPIRKIEELPPKSISSMGEGRYIVDLGQNFAGWLRISLNAAAGSKIHLGFAETLTADGNIDPGSTRAFFTKLEQIDQYIAKGGGPETWEPRFTYHSFRYVEISGWPGVLYAENITGVVVHTDLRPAGNFLCSDERLNLLHQMALWTHRSNIYGIPTDCPGRERLGWLGDANLVAEFSLWNFDGKAFWEKYLDDIETTRIQNRGLPGKIAPGKRGTRGIANPDWAAAFIMIPWYLYVQYGDPDILKQHWEGMQRLMTHYAKIAKGWIINEGYGDWCDPGDKYTVNNTPPSLTSTFWFYRCAKVMSSIARIVNCTDLSTQYTKWTSLIQSAIFAKFFNSATGSFGSQTANAMALEFGAVPHHEETRVFTSLVRDIQERENHLSTGIMGVRVIFEVLTRYQQGALALALMHQNTYPSFGHLISRGATTLWECWEDNKHDMTHGPRSLNHPMMGGFDNWFYTMLAGIRPDPLVPGFKHFYLNPYPINGLEWVRCQYECPAGQIVSKWTHSNRKFEWTVVVPQNTSATVTLPFSRQIQELQPGEFHLVDEFR